MSSERAELRTTARQLLAKSDPAAAVQSVAKAVRDDRSTVSDQQACMHLLSEIARPDSDKLLASALSDLVARPKSAGGTWSHIKNLELDIVEAASKQNSGRIVELLSFYRIIEK